LAPLAAQLQEALTLAEDAAHSVARQAAVGEGEGNLEALDDRLHALKTAARRMGCSVPELATQQAELAAQVQENSGLTAAAAQAAQVAAAAQAQFQAACRALSQGRQTAAAALAPQLQQALRALLLPQAEVAVELTPLPPTHWGAQGAETVQIMLAANPGSPVQPIQKVASGGELARLLLALKQVFYAKLPPQVLVLDEVDTGLSGAAASAVGAALAALGRQHQVLAVTHHAQVAAHAGTHGKLTKQVQAGATTTQLQWLQGPARLEELARLLAGENITPEARAAAQALLAEARTPSLEQVA
jgi:DNA repair protein RecN (Recombination protein N)